MSERYRLLTRADFDGLVCAVLLDQLRLIDEIKLVEPSDIQAGRVAVGARDITANLPYAPGVHLAFDHQSTEALRNAASDAHVIDAGAASAARVIFEHYGGAGAFPALPPALLEAADRGDSAAFSLQDVLDPHDWVLLYFLLDARTGLERFRAFRVSTYALIMDLVRSCTRLPIAAILELPDVRERADLYREQAALAAAQIRRVGCLRGELLLLDLRAEAPVYATNRFMHYALFPEASVSLHVMPGARGEGVRFSAGDSIFRRGRTPDLGQLMLGFGGGGHPGAGGCTVKEEAAARVLDELIAALAGGR